MSRTFLIVVITFATLRPLQWIYLSWQGHTGALHFLPEGDFASAWVAAKLAQAHDWHAIYDYKIFVERYARYFPGIVAPTPYLYPPPMLFVLQVFAPLSVLVGYFLWLSCGIGGLILALRSARVTWSKIVMVLVSPPVSYNLLLGQNGIVAGSLLIAALALADRRPRASGFIAALLTIKPHLGLVLPIAWMAQRRWLTIGIATTLTLGIFGVTALYFGTDSWLLYKNLALPEARFIMDAPFP